MKILIIMLIIILVVLAILYFVIGNYFYNIALNPNTSKSYVLGEIDTTIDEGETWLSKSSEDVYITSSNNGSLSLHGYEIKNPRGSNIWTILVHGYYGKGSDMAYYAEQYFNRGYNVLLVDLRGHGNSQGDYIGMGWHDRLDLIDWARYLINKKCRLPNNFTWSFYVELTNQANVENSANLRCWWHHEADAVEIECLDQLIEKFGRL